jgi:MoxR-like ATPase
VHEKAILNLVRTQVREKPSMQLKKVTPLSQSTLFAARQEILNIHLADALEDYLIQLILATRQPQAYGEDFAMWMRYGASPRATIALDRCVRARAWLLKRDFVTPEDIQDMVFDVLRHRLILSYEAEAEGMTTDDVIKMLISRIPVP